MVDVLVNSVFMYMSNCVNLFVFQSVHVLSVMIVLPVSRLPAAVILRFVASDDML